MSQNMSTLDRALRTFVVAPAAIVIAVVVGAGSVRRDRAVRARSRDVRDERDRLLPALPAAAHRQPRPHPAAPLTLRRRTRDGCNNRELRARGARALARAAGRGRLLGRLVRPLSDARPGARARRPRNAMASSSWSRSTSTRTPSSRSDTRSRGSRPSRPSATERSCASSSVRSRRRRSPSSSTS